MKPHSPYRASSASAGARVPLLDPLERRVLLTGLPAGFAETEVVTGLTNPSAMEFAPDGRLFVLEQGGNVRLVHSDGTTFTALHVNVESTGERGLLGIAFDPQFASDHFVYLYYTNPNGGGPAISVHNQISRFTVDDTDPQHPVFGNEAPILDFNDLGGGTGENGGAMHFGTDGMLYVGVGVSGDGNNAQTLGNLEGKMLRINTAGFTGARDDSTPGHIIPADNPSVGIASGINQLIFAIGLRNPFTFAVQPGTGRIFVNDVGQDAFEEVDDLLPGANYGWPNSEGFRKPSDLTTTIGTYHDPVLAYGHNEALNIRAIVGGVFYNPATPQFPSSFVGKYFFTDVTGGIINVFDPSTVGSLSNPDTSTSFATGDLGKTVDLKVDAAGSLYYLSRTNGSVQKISFQAPTPTPTPTPAIALAINAGGTSADSYTTDTGFKGGRANRVRHTIDTSAVSNPASQLVYQTSRVGDFSYVLGSLTPGTVYKVRLDFSENQFASAGRRAFDVAINGAAALTNFNIFSAAGGRFKALEKDLTATADANGQITLQFHKKVGAARVNGILVET